MAPSMKKPAAAMKKPAARVAAKSPKASPAKKTSARSRSRSPRAVSDTLKNLPALMLGLDRRPDRRDRCMAMLAKEVPWLNVKFFSATDGKATHIPDHEVSKTWNTMNNSLYGAYEDVKDASGNVLYTAEQFADPGVDYEFSPGERGCAHSHYRMWEVAAAAQGPTLILEDDVVLEFDRTVGGRSNGKNFTRRFELGMSEAIKKDADVLYLGWSGHREGNYKYHEEPKGKKNPVIRKAEYVWTTVAYVIWPKGAKKLLNAAQPMNQPVDNFMAWECREHRLDAYVILDDGETDDTWAGGIVTQLDFIGDSDIIKSDGGDQGHDPAEFLAKK